MIGTDSEYFFTDGTVAIPAKDVLSLHPDRVEVFKDIPSDLDPAGYHSSVVPLGDVTLIEDGLAFELPLKPSSNVETIVARLRKGIQEAWRLAEGAGLSISATPLIYLRSEDLKDHPELRVLGCSPDMCVYDGLTENVPYQNPKKTLWRTSGFHIHFSIPGIKKDGRGQSLVTACDATIGLADVLFEHSPLGKQRRTMYGSAGKYRIQRWGIEYRTPSGAVSAHPMYVRSILYLAKMLHTAFEKNLFTGDDLLSVAGFTEVVAAINQVDYEKAKQLYQTVLDFLEERGAPLHNSAYLPLESYVTDYEMRAWKDE